MRCLRPPGSQFLELKPFAEAQHNMRKQLGYSPIRGAVILGTDCGLGFSKRHLEKMLIDKEFITVPTAIPSAPLTGCVQTLPHTENQLSLENSRGSRTR